MGETHQIAMGFTYAARPILHMQLQSPPVGAGHARENRWHKPLLLLKRRSTAAYCKCSNSAWIGCRNVAFLIRATWLRHE